MLKLNNVQLVEIYKQLYDEDRIKSDSRAYQRMMNLRKGIKDKIK